MDPPTVTNKVQQRMTKLRELISNLRDRPACLVEMMEYWDSFGDELKMEDFEEAKGILVQDQAATATLIHESVKLGEDAINAYEDLAARGVNSELRAENDALKAENEVLRIELEKTKVQLEKAQKTDK